MKQLNFEIAQQHFGVRGDKECDLLATVPGFEPFLSSQEAEYCVEFGHEVAVPSNAQCIHSFMDDDAPNRSTLYRAPEGFYFQLEPITPEQKALVIFHDGSNLVRGNEATDGFMLKFVLWMAFSMLVAKKMCFSIHSSTIVKDNRAVMFLGESGTGKSTHTRLWREFIPDCHLLNDDSPFLALTSEGVRVFGSPWSGKTHCYHNLNFPLAGIVRLSQAPFNRITPLPALNAFAAIQPSCPPALAQDEGFADLIVDFLSEVVSNVPFFHLECLPDEAAAQLSYKTVFNQ